MTSHVTLRFLPLIGLAGALAVSGCSKPLDIDLRSLGTGFSTTSAVQNLGDRPAPDSRGVISYPTYKVAMARRGDTVADVARRVGLEPADLAQRNALSPDTRLRGGEMLALPGDTPAASGNNGAPLPSGAEPLRHRVTAGETAYSISRLYDVPLGALQRYNGLADNQSLRAGQTLLIPVAGAAITATALPAAAAASTAPGAGTPTPTPPSVRSALPTERTDPVASGGGGNSGGSATPAPSSAPQPAPQTTRASEQSSSRMVRPMAGSIIREYSSGRNEGIDIGGSPGTSIKAADAGVVLHISDEKIVIIKHQGELLTVYRGLGNLSISKGDRVSRGQTIGSLASGNPAALHFEVRQGMQSVDPGDFLP